MTQPHPRGLKMEDPKWKDTEDLLLACFHQQGLDWTTISAEIPGRSAEACEMRWSQIHSAYETEEDQAMAQATAEATSGLPRRWDDSEVEKLVQLKKKGLRITEIAAQLPGRTQAAINHQWYKRKADRDEEQNGSDDDDDKPLAQIRAQMSRKDAKRWSEKEDTMLMKMHNEGKSWEVIAAAIPGRTQSACENRLFWLRGGDKRKGSSEHIDGSKNAPGRAVSTRGQSSPSGHTKVSEMEKLHIRELIKQGKNVEQIVALFPGKLHIRATVRNIQGHMWSRGEVAAAGFAPQPVIPTTESSRNANASYNEPVSALLAAVKSPTTPAQSRMVTPVSSMIKSEIFSDRSITNTPASMQPSRLTSFVPESSQASTPSSKVDRSWQGFNGPRPDHQATPNIKQAPPKAPPGKVQITDLDSDSSTEGRRRLQALEEEAQDLMKLKRRLDREKEIKIREHENRELRMFLDAQQTSNDEDE